MPNQQSTARLTPTERAIERMINGVSMATVLADFEQEVNADLLAALKAVDAVCGDSKWHKCSRPNRNGCALCRIEESADAAIQKAEAAQ